MVINFLGDSITEGAGAGSPENMYVNLVGQKLGAAVNNYGVGGTRIARQTTPTDPPRADEDFLIRAAKMDKNADFVFVFGGTNDFGHGDAPLGKFGDKTPYTFYGAAALLCEYLLGIYGKDRLCFILPLHRTGENSVYGDGRKKQPSATLAEYINALLQVLSHYGVGYMDIRDKFPPQKFSELTADGLHPNAKGNQIIADSVCDYLKNHLNIKEK